MIGVNLYDVSLVCIGSFWFEQILVISFLILYNEVFKSYSQCKITHSFSIFQFLQYNFSKTLIVIKMVLSLWEEYFKLLKNSYFFNMIYLSNILFFLIVKRNIFKICGFFINTWKFLKLVLFLKNMNIWSRIFLSYVN